MRAKSAITQARQSVLESTADWLAYQYGRNIPDLLGTAQEGLNAIVAVMLVVLLTPFAPVIGWISRERMRRECGREWRVNGSKP